MFRLMISSSLGALLMTTFTPENARALLFKTSEVSREQFQRTALEKNQKTYTEFSYDKWNDSGAEAHAQVQDFAHNLLGTTGTTTKRQIEDWNLLRATVSLNAADREILFLLAQKLNLRTEVCRHQLLKPPFSKERFVVASCGSQSIPHGVLRKIQRRDLLIIDGIAFRQDEIPKSLEKGSYQWRIISDEFQDLAFTGTAEHFARQNFTAKPWVAGGKSNYELHHDDLNIVANSQIVFKEAKVAPGLPAPRTLLNWAEDHKTALWTVGILLAGFAAYSLKDKNLIISNP